MQKLCSAVKPNKCSTQFQLKLVWDLETFKELLGNYQDIKIINYLKYSCPISNKGNIGNSVPHPKYEGSSVIPKRYSGLFRTRKAKQYHFGSL